jgi:hypothetical protein
MSYRKWIVDTHLQTVEKLEQPINCARRARRQVDEHAHEPHDHYEGPQNAQTDQAPTAHNLRPTDTPAIPTAHPPDRLGL